MYQYYSSKTAFPKLKSQKDCRSAVVLLNDTTLFSHGEPKNCLLDGLGELNELIRNTLSAGIRVLKLKFYHSTDWLEATIIHVRAWNKAQNVWGLSRAFDESNFNLKVLIDYWFKEDGCAEINNRALSVSLKYQKLLLKRNDHFHLCFH